MVVGVTVAVPSLYEIAVGFKVPLVKLSTRSRISTEGSMVVKVEALLAATESGLEPTSLTTGRLVGATTVIGRMTVAVLPARSRTE